jgi:hypothetical protein
LLHLTSKEGRKMGETGQESVTLEKICMSDNGKRLPFRRPIGKTNRTRKRLRSRMTLIGKMGWFIF